jgi:beta-1,4-mannosyltransferase
MRILAQPAFKNRKQNPYNWLLYSHIQKIGVNVDEYSITNFLFKKYQIWHLHWPEYSLNHPNISIAFFRIVFLLIQIKIAYIKGIKIVWTIHNLSAHEKRYPILENWFWNNFIQHLHAYISLTTSGIKHAQERFQHLQKIKGFMILHGHYRDEYDNSINSEEARSLLEISPRAKVLLFFGQIRHYKNIPHLLKVFKSINAPDILLYIVGLPKDLLLVEEIKQLATLDQRVKLHLDFVPKDDVQKYFAAANLVILPYREILNSGSALLSLSFNKPILVPCKGAMSELKNQVGEDWVRTYEGELTSSDIEEAMECVFNNSKYQKVQLDALEWSKLAEQTVTVYESILDR